MNIQAIAAAIVEHCKTEEKAAEFIGVGQSTVNRWIHGKMPRGENLSALMLAARRVPKANALLMEGGQTIEKVDAEFAPDTIPGDDLVGDRNLPIYAAAMGGDGHEIVTFDAIDYVRRPAVLENVRNAYGLYVVGDSMSPAFEPGDTALVHPHKPPSRGRNVVLYSVAPNGHPTATAIIKYLVAFNDSEWTLRQFNPVKEFKVKRADWPHCHRIVGKYDSQ